MLNPAASFILSFRAYMHVFSLDLFFPNAALEMVVHAHEWIFSVRLIGDPALQANHLTKLEVSSSLMYLKD